MGMLSRRWNVHPPHDVTVAFEPRLDVGGDLVDMSFAELIAADEDVQPVELGRLPEFGDGLGGDVAVNHVFHPRLSLARIVNPPSDADRMRHAVSDFDGRGITDVKFCDL